MKFIYSLLTLLSLTYSISAFARVNDPTMSHQESSRDHWSVMFDGSLVNKPADFEEGLKSGRYYAVDCGLCASHARDKAEFQVVYRTFCKNRGHIEIVERARSGACYGVSRPLLPDGQMCMNVVSFDAYCRSYK